MCLGIPGKVVEIVDEDEHRAMAEVEGVRREISLALFNQEDDLKLEDEKNTEVGVGDWVLIHVGFAMSKIDEEEANETLTALRNFGEMFDGEVEEFAAAGDMDPFDYNPAAPVGGEDPGSDDYNPDDFPRAPIGVGDETTGSGTLEAAESSELEDATT